MLGEVERGEIGFRAEMRSEVARLGAKAGARYIPECSAKVGDARCGIDLDSSEFKGSGTVSALLGDGFTATGLGSFRAGWFARGALTWTSGPNDGIRSEVRGFTAGITGRALALWRDPPFPIEVGDHFTVTAGCDKSFATCKAKFANAANFRGFPHMPGEGFVAEYAVAGDPSLDGGSRND